MIDPGAPDRVLVTGAAQGLGFAIAEAFLASGTSRAALADLNIETLTEAVGILGERYGSGRVIGFPVDVRDDSSVLRMTSDAVSFAGGLDALVTCAGVISRGEAASHSWDLWQRDIEVNVGGTYRCARHAFPSLRESPAAAIVTVGSLGSFLGMPRRVSYNTSKAGILGLTRTLAAEWGPLGIRVNAIAPGFVETSMMRSGLDTGLLDERRIIDRLPLKRLGRPSEIADVAVFLASTRAAYVTGAILPVDGGVLADGTFS
ncbi:MAG: SDR family NAD(P)-dependent oxidoreductase [Acidimicrobiales bacterium]